MNLNTFVAVTPGVPGTVELYLVGLRVGDVVHLAEPRVRDGAAEGDEPEGGDDLAGPPEAGHGVRVQRVADGEIPELGKGH